MRILQKDRRFVHEVQLRLVQVGRFRQRQFVNVAIPPMEWCCALVEVVKMCQNDLCTEL